MPSLALRKKSENTPDEAFVGCNGVSATVHVFPPSVERKTRATAAPPVANQTSFLPCTVRHELLAAKAPSFGSAGGRDAGGTCFQVEPPSSVVKTAKCPATGSLSTIPCLRSQKATASKKTPAVFCS